MAEAAAALLALWNDVAPELDGPYNDWHAREHVPQRLTVPGMVWARRYGRCGHDNAAPRYLTLYGLRDPEVLESEPYRQLLREPTPMSREMRPALRNLSRWVCTLHHDEGADAGAFLAVRTLPREADGRGALLGLHGAAGRLLAERLDSASPLPWVGAGQAGDVEGHWLLAAAFAHLADAQASAATVYERLPVGRQLSA
ncbi:DUF4286 family protein [Piscinibacter sp. XHJ-5]|uniref:DUF4286 family protein n=1 Tax=Piscinibacter sp. XHJ-5 TaxID=3037797 RepID=UPI0024528AD2|nr:DUF4286 family protein [Piscinibacter sp. XHJ-5]